MYAANDRDVRIVLANDPDADRFAAAEKVGLEWHQFTGDEVGILLAAYLLAEMGEQQTHMITTAVSSQMLSVMAAKRDNVVVEETLTGFKWIGQRALDIQHEGKSVSFGYEEALGYMFPSVVHDKDGIVAALYFLRLCDLWVSPHAKLQDLYREYGYFSTQNRSFRYTNLGEALKELQRIRKTLRACTKIASWSVTRLRDLVEPYDSASEDNKPDLPIVKGNYMITCWLATTATTEDAEASSVRFTIRASGTEPKIKLYLECRASSQKAVEQDVWDAVRNVMVHLSLK